jgi:hypothetical protein
MSKPQLKVGIVVNSLRGGGAENSMSELNRTLIANGFESYLIGVNSFDQDSLGSNSSEIEIGRLNKSGLYETFQSWRRFKRVISAIKPDVIIINCELPEFLVAISNIKAKVFLVEHSSKPWLGRKPLGILVRVILKFKKVNYVSVSHQITIWHSYGGKHKVIENLLSDAQPTISSLNQHKETRLLFLGRLVSQKCPELFLEIQESCRIPGLIIGDGVLDAKLRAQVLLTGQDVTFAGYQKQPWSFVTNNDLLIIPSSYEGKPLVILEALSRNIQIFAANIPELRNEFSEYGVIFCDTRDDYAREITKYLENKQSVQGNNRKFSIQIHNKAATISWIKALAPQPDSQE